jgi:DNA-directed RNA polymerase subunit beta
MPALTRSIVVDVAARTTTHRQIAREKDPAHDTDEALKDIYTQACAPATRRPSANAKAMLKRLVLRSEDVRPRPRWPPQDQPASSASNASLEARIAGTKDVVEAIKLPDQPALRREGDRSDDIDHLGSRRVRPPSANFCKPVPASAWRAPSAWCKERMTLFDRDYWTRMTPQKLINPKALSAVIRDFFGRSAAEPVHGPDEPASAS